MKVGPWRANCMQCRLTQSIDGIDEMIVVKQNLYQVPDRCENEKLYSAFAHLTIQTTDLQTLDSARQPSAERIRRKPTIHKAGSHSSEVRPQRRFDHNRQLPPAGEVSSCHEKQQVCARRQTNRLSASSVCCTLSCTWIVGAWNRIASAQRTWPSCMATCEGVRPQLNKHYFFCITRSRGNSPILHSSRGSELKQQLYWTDQPQLGKCTQWRVALLVQGINVDAKLSE